MKKLILLLFLLVISCKKDGDTRSLAPGTTANIKNESLTNMYGPYQVIGIAKAYSDGSEMNFYWMVSANLVLIELPDNDVQPTGFDKTIRVAKWMPFDVANGQTNTYIKIDTNGFVIVPNVITANPGR